MALEHREAVSVRSYVEAAPPLDERDDRRHRERSLRHERQRLADRHLVPVARRAPPDLLVPVRRHDRRELTLGVARRFGRAVFAALARGVTLGAEAPGVGLAHELARLVPKRGPVDLLDRAARERGRLLDEIEQHALAD